jgi:sec-independent protein translocase protein TatC
LAEKENTGGDLTMTILEHLEELRSRLIKIIIAAALGFAVGYYYSKPILDFLEKPLIAALPEAQKQLIYTGLTEAFFTYLKVGLLAGIFIASPFILYQVWAFVSPGLYKKEKSILVPVTVVSFFLFVGGAAFAYFIVFPTGFKVLIGLTDNTSQVPFIKMQEYFSFVMWMLLAFGVSFELPVVIFLLSRFGIVSYQGLKKFRLYALLGAFILGAVLTPTGDIINQSLLAVPLFILYEVSIWITFFFGKKKEPIVEEDGASVPAERREEP